MEIQGATVFRNFEWVFSVRVYEVGKKKVPLENDLFSKLKVV